MKKYLKNNRNHLPFLFDCLYMMAMYPTEPHTLNCVIYFFSVTNFILADVIPKIYYKLNNLML